MTDQDRIWASLQLQSLAPELLDFLDDELFYLMTCTHNEPLLRKMLVVLVDFPWLKAACHASHKLGHNRGLNRLLDWANEQRR